MSTSNQDKGYVNMKKLIALIAVLFSVVAPVQSQASAGERIIIIDSYFDKSKVTGPVEFVCLATDKCVNTPTPKPGLGSDAANHGTIMANIAREQNSTATLVLIQTEEVSINKKTNVASISTLDGSDFIKALTWVKNNNVSVSVVSFSYNLTNANAKHGECRISAQGGSVVAMDSSIKSLVASLKSYGIPVLAAAGNDNKKPLNYPACLSDVVSVGSTGSPTYHQNGVKVLATLINADNTANMSKVSPWFGSVNFTTSAATIAVASNWKFVHTGKTSVSILSN
jgi:hypothetical protein